MGADQRQAFLNDRVGDALRALRYDANSVQQRKEQDNRRTLAKPDQRRPHDQNGEMPA